MQCCFLHGNSICTDENGGVGARPAGIQEAVSARANALVTLDPTRPRIRWASTLATQDLREAFVDEEDRFFFLFW